MCSRAQSIYVHMISRLSNNLFKTGKLESETCNTVLFQRDSHFAYSTTNGLSLHLDCNMTNATQHSSYLRTINNQMQIGWIFPFSFIVDEVEIRVHPLKSFLSGSFNHTHIQNLYTPNKLNGNYSKAFVAFISQGCLLLISFDIIADLHLIHFINNHQLIEASFDKFINNLPTESESNPKYYKTYSSLWNIPTISIRTRAKVLYQFIILLANLISTIDCSPLPWQSVLMVREQVTIESIEAVDIQSFTFINEMEITIEENIQSTDTDNDINNFLNSIWDYIRFECISSVQEIYEVIPDSHKIPITASNFKGYCTLYRHSRLNEFR
ncbi:unnamed protein product [Rotaria sp. Silwood2]|nr:unnamed protein product [Rotaria sp. Silwood2]